MKIKKLFKKALKIRENAYAKYSNFKVGVAILADDGNIYCGANVENGAYPEGVCAEAGAISAMISAGATHIKDIVVVVKNGFGTPCGGCRQKIFEFATKDTKIHICNKKGFIKTFNIDELLPYGFKL